MKKFIGLISIVMIVLIGLFACDAEKSSSVSGGGSAGTTTSTDSSSSSSQSGDSSSSSASDSSSSEDSSSSSSSQEPTIIQYTVVFDANGGTGTMANQTFIYDETQDLNNCSFTPPTGHQFGGWNTAANGQGDTFANGAAVKNIAEANGSITLYAQWILGNGTITVVTPTYQDINNLLSYADGTFTALSGYQSYRWYIDEESQSELSQTFTPDTLSLSAGGHSVMVIVTDSQGGAYSAEMTFQIRKDY